VCNDSTRGNGSKLKEGRFRLDIRKKFFTMEVVKPWPRLPREAVAALSLAVFKARLNGALSSLVWWKMSLLLAGGLEPDGLQGPFQPLPFYDCSIAHCFGPLKLFTFCRKSILILLICSEILKVISRGLRCTVPINLYWNYQ